MTRDYLDVEVEPSGDARSLGEDRAGRFRPAREGASAEDAAAAAGGGFVSWGRRVAAVGTSVDPVRGGRRPQVVPGERACDLVLLSHLDAGLLFAAPPEPEHQRDCAGRQHSHHRQQAEQGLPSLPREQPPAMFLGDRS
jgi:hypothetical protein